MIKKALLTLLSLTLILHADFYYSGGKRHILKKIKSSRTLSNQKSIYQTKSGQKMVVDDKIIVAFSNLKVQKSIEDRYDLVLIKRLTKNMFLYRLKDSSKTLNIANSIYHQEGIKFSHPDFIVEKKSRALTRDPYVYKAWYLKDRYYYNKSDINVEEAWRYTKGEGVKIALYDDGIDIDHPDLRENIYTFANFNDPNSNIPYSSDKDEKWHGTACAGLMVASENRIGSVGVAPKAKLYAVGYSKDNVSKDIEAYSWLMKEGVSVINNSWGSYKNLDAYSEIFKELATRGRDGKGIMIIFAAGNNSDNLDDEGIDDESESPYVLSITASTIHKKIAQYANYGSAIDFTAPGGSVDAPIFTTDARGSLGYTYYEYTENFIGTSAAAPLASATIALMIATNPKLSRDDIIEILKFTAKKYGDYPYDKNGHNNHWGYGMIDAGKAVALADSYGKSKLKNFAHAIFEDQY